MIYILDDEAGKEALYIRSDLYKYIIKVRRHKEGDELSFRSRKNMDLLYTYKLDKVEPRSAELLLVSSKVQIVKSERSLHIGWCVIDSNSIERVLPSLCEVGVEKISFISCDRSQKNFKPDLKRFERIMEASMQQCGRSTYIEFDFCSTISEFVKNFPDVNVFDFCDNFVENYSDIKTVLIGCEGGFSSKERENLLQLKRFKLDTPMVLRSESATLAVASKILL